MLVRVFRACFPDSYQLVPSLLLPITRIKTLGKIQIMTFWQQKSKGIQTLPRQIRNKPCMEVPLFPTLNSPWHASMNSTQLLKKDHMLPTCNTNSVGTDQLPSQESLCTWNKLEELYKVLKMRKKRKSKNWTCKHNYMQLAPLHTYKISASCREEDSCWHIYTAPDKAMPEEHPLPSTVNKLTYLHI